MNENILELEGISLNFPGVRALSSIDLDIRSGEAHILLGENGAGKSSLVKILCGIHRPDSGRMRYKGAAYAPQSPLDAIRAGIRVVYQEFNLLSYLSVAENIFFERLPSRAGVVDFGRMNQGAKLVLESVGLDVSPRTPVELLGVAQMQLLEIAKALSGDSSVLILDEPTATLTPKEIGKLFAIIRKLKAKGVTIIYISHRLKEIFDIGDRVTVLRNGTKVATREIGEVTIPDIVKMMVGREMSSEYPFRDDVKRGPVILDVRGLKRVGNPHAVSFRLREGEILGISGLVGSGRTEMVRALFGADPKVDGEIYLRGRKTRISSPHDAVESGICLLTEDRKSQGLILDMACSVNITLPALRKVSRAGLLDFKAEREAAESLVKELGIRTPSVAQWTRHLSGGNQQKVVLAKWLFREAQVLVLDEPTRGIDVGAKYEIYYLLWKLAEAGKGIIIVSSDLPELLGVCHRILVISDGKLTADIDRASFDQERVLSHAYQEYLGEGRKQ